MSTRELLSVITSALRDTTSDSLGIPTTSSKDWETGKVTKVQKTISQYYRAKSQFSAHDLDVSPYKLAAQFTNLLKRDSTIVEALGNNFDKYITLASTKLSTRLLQLASTKGYLIEGSIISIETSNNNYAKVSELIKEALDTTDKYDIYSYLDSVSTDLGIDKLPKSSLSKFGFDIGHKDSNTASAYGAVIFNALRQSSKFGTRAHYLKTTEVGQALEELDNIFSNPSYTASIIKASGINDFDLMQACIGATIEFTKELNNRDYRASLKITAEPDLAVISRVAKTMRDTVFLEDASTNQAKGREFEKRLANLLVSKSNKSFAGLLDKLSQGGIVELKSSPSSEDIILTTIEELIIGKPYADTKRDTTAKLKKGDVNLTPFVTLIKPTRQKVISQILPVPRLRTPKGQFTSLINIDNLIRAKLRATVEKNMHKPALVYRTGRFADSVKLQNVENRQGTLTAFLTYMKYPYATFEPGNRQGSKARSPSALIDRSVREIAKTIVTARMKTVIV